MLCKIYKNRGRKFFLQSEIFLEYQKFNIYNEDVWRRLYNKLKFNNKPERRKLLWTKN